MASVPKVYKLQHSINVFSLGCCICSGLLGGTAGFKESEDKAGEEEGVEVTALSPSDKTQGDTTSFIIVPCPASFPDSVCHKRYAASLPMLT